jgi:type IV secretory pathway TraG/TraD family ATPase VirD4
MNDILKNIGKVGLATGQIVINDMVKNIKYGIEYFDEEDKKAPIGKWQDVIDNGTNGFCLNGTDILRPDIANTITLFAGTGQGKSTVPMATTLGRLTTGSAIVFDPAGTLVPITASRFDRLNFGIHNIDFSNILNSSSFNVFDAFKTDDDAMRFMAHIHRVANKGGQTDVFFMTSSIALTSFLAKLIMRCDKRYRNMANLIYLLDVFPQKKPSKPGEPETRVFNKLAVKYCTDLMFNEYKGLISNQSERTMGSILLTAKSTLHHYASEALCRASAFSSIDFESLSAKNQIVYITANAYDASYYQDITSVTIELAYRALMREVKQKSNKVFFLLDECAICSLPSLSEVVSTCRKFNIYNLLCYQNQGQLYNSYGRELSNNILGNSSRLYLGYQDYQTVNDITQLLGKRTVTDRQGRSQERHAIDPNEILRMNRSEGLFVHRNVAYRLKLSPYYEQPFLKADLRGRPYNFSNRNIPSQVPLIPLT